MSGTHGLAKCVSLGRHMRKHPALPIFKVLGEKDGRVTGLACWHDGWLEQLYVDPARHGRGTGTALLARQAGAPGRLSFGRSRRTPARGGSMSGTASSRPG
jgi:GNAT superfamily N-acetyltransferase